MPHTTRRPLFLAFAALAFASYGRADGGQPAADWRGARWGMTAEEVLAAMPGEARRLERAEKLADGNVVAVGIEREVIAGTEFRVRFVFDRAGGLTAVSLRTDASRYAGPDVFEATRTALAERLGAPAEQTADDAFVDMRQATWRTGRSRVDVKYIPGVVVVLHTPSAAGR